MTDDNKNFMSGGTSRSQATSSDDRGADIPRDGAGNGGAQSTKELEAATMPTRRLTQGITDEALLVPGAGQSGGDRRMVVAPPAQPPRSQMPVQSRSSSQQPEEHAAVTFVDNGANNNGVGDLNDDLESKITDYLSSSLSNTVHGGDGATKHRRNKQRMLHGAEGDPWKDRDIQFPSWVASNQDILAEILARLPQEQMLQAATVCRLFKQIITSHGFRYLVRTNPNQHPGGLLGFFPKGKVIKKDSYPFIYWSGSLCQMSSSLQYASFSVWGFWKPTNHWGHCELLDSRDGKLLLLAGKSSRNVEMFVFYPHSRTNQFSKIPRLALLDQADIRLVTAALIPDDKSHHFSVIVLTRRGVVDSQMKAKVPLAESSATCFNSLSGQWGIPVTTQFKMPAKKMLRVGSVLVGNTLHFLHSCRQVIQVNVQTLEIAQLNLPRVKSLWSRTTHVIVRGRNGDQLYLAVISERDIFTYAHSNTGWNGAFRNNMAPLGAPSISLRLVGSSEAGVVLVKVYTQVYTMEVETGMVKWMADGVFEEDVLCYEQEFPPVSQLLRQQQQHEV